MTPVPGRAGHRRSEVLAHVVEDQVEQDGAQAAQRDAAAEDDLRPVRNRLAPHRVAR